MPDLLADLPIPIADQIAELRREQALRRRVYVRWVADGKMKAVDAERWQARLDAAIATLEGANA